MTIDHWESILFEVIPLKRNQVNIVKKIQNYQYRIAEAKTQITNHQVLQMENPKVIVTLINDHLYRLQRRI